MKSRTLRSGASDTLIRPSRGRLSSRTRPIASATESALENNATKTVALRGATRPKLMKRVVLQKPKHDEEREG